ncbi:RNA polymerase sigma factor [Nocardioides mangrovi]|uniref:RNA polymerase sigma factor n=1 Tax=Nocardioides mangrovi TaxID=2874580 RepID=A0ABS7U8S5_9ACTN|nr:RNA polymerase sigma factor [Nocardioides mangrovi]MBZ5737380.1 RNA polymerase sigma factor [Nocardioides mangrovi]
MNRRDDEQVTRAKQGDAEAWRALYRAHAGRLLVWLGTRPTQDYAVAPEDLAAEAWLVAAQKVQDFHGDSDAFAGWLFGIARHLGSNISRRGQRRATTPADTLTMPHPAVSGPEAAYAGHDWVTRVLAGLPPRERDVVTCCDVVGLDVAATAEALGMTAVAVRVARHRGLRRLRGLVPADPGTRTDPEPAAQVGSSARSRSR